MSQFKGKTLLITGGIGTFGIVGMNHFLNTNVSVSAKVMKIIQSYTGVVDKMVWRKF